MDETETQKTWRGDASVLGEVGAVLLGQSQPPVKVRLPRRLAEQAVAAWERDDGEGPLDPETSEQAARRLLAGRWPSSASASLNAGGGRATRL